MIFFDVAGTLRRSAVKYPQFPKEDILSGLVAASNLLRQASARTQRPNLSDPFTQAGHVFYLQLIVRGPVPLFYFSSVTFARLHLIQSFITPLLPVFSCFVLRSLFTFQDITPVHSLPVQEQHNFRSLWIHTAGSGGLRGESLSCTPWYNSEHRKRRHCTYDSLGSRVYCQYRLATSSPERRTVEHYCPLGGEFRLLPVWIAT